MEDFAAGYAPEDYNKKMEPGDYRAKITEVVDGTSRAGNSMRTVKLITRESAIEFKHWLVKNEHFNANATKFFDCFKIPRGNFDPRAWVGKVGLVHIEQGKPNDQGKSYMEIAYLITDSAAQAMAPAAPPPVVTAPPPPAPAADPWGEPARTAPADSFVDDIPFNYGLPANPRPRGAQ